MEIQDKINMLRQRNLMLRSNTVSQSHFSANIIADPVQISSFSAGNSDDFDLPLRVSGRLITAGEYPDKMYRSAIISPEELKKTLNLWVGIKMFKNHDTWLKIYYGKHADIDDVVGKIINTRWIAKHNAIDYDAEIYDRGIAYKILMNVIENVSVGFRNDITVVDGKYYKINIIPNEVSLVFNPRDSNASIKAQV